MLFISHDETLIERTANMVIHIEQIIRKTKARYTVAKLLDEVESGENLTARQQQYHEKTKIRDLAMMTLLLGTGILIRSLMAALIRL